MRSIAPTRRAAPGFERALLRGVGRVAEVFEGCAVELCEAALFEGAADAVVVEGVVEELAAVVDFAEADGEAVFGGESERGEARAAGFEVLVEADEAVDQGFAVVCGQAHERGRGRLLVDAELGEGELGGGGGIGGQSEQAVPELEAAFVGDQGEREAAPAEERDDGVGRAFRGVAGDGVLQSEHFFADRRAAALDADTGADELLVEEVGFGVDELAAGVVIDVQGCAVLPVGGLVDAVAGGMERAVDGDIALRGQCTAFGNAHDAAEVERLAVVGEAGDGVVDDDLDLRALCAGREEWVAFAFGDPELVFLAAELGDQRRAEQQQQREMGDEGGELGPAEAVGEEFDGVVGSGDLLDAVATGAEGGGERGGALVGRSGLGQVERGAVAGALEVGRR